MPVCVLSPVDVIAIVSRAYVSGLVCPNLTGWLPIFSHALWLCVPGGLASSAKLPDLAYNALLACLLALSRRAKPACLRELAPFLTLPQCLLLAYPCFYGLAFPGLDYRRVAYPGIAGLTGIAITSLVFPACTLRLACLIPSDI